MPSYCFYILNATGRLINRIDAHCVDDEAALKLASELIGQAAVSEVWDGDRLVGRVVAPERQSLAVRQLGVQCRLNLQLKWKIDRGADPYRSQRPDDFAKFDVSLAGAFRSFATECHDVS